MENTYVLFGSEAVASYQQDGVSGLKKMYLGGDEPQMCMYTSETPITDILCDAQGWGDNCIMEERHYTRLKKWIHKRKTTQEVEITLNIEVGVELSKDEIIEHINKNIGFYCSRIKVIEESEIYKTEE